MSKPTCHPLPWRLAVDEAERSLEVLSADGRRIVRSLMHDCGERRAVQRADFALLVRAVNCHWILCGALGALDAVPHGRHGQEVEQMRRMAFEALDRERGAS